MSYQCELITESDRKFLTFGGATGTILNHQTENEILHPDISKFGHTTNVLIYSFLDNNRGQQFTRRDTEIVRIAQTSLGRKWHGGTTLNKN